MCGRIAGHGLAGSVGGLSMFKAYHTLTAATNDQKPPAEFPSGRLIRCGDALARIEKLSEGRLLGRFYAASRARLREVTAAQAPCYSSIANCDRIP